LSDQPLKWQFPEKLGFVLNEQHRYKVAYGGRDGAKSWSYARALLALGAEKPLRIGCFREVQRSIKDSVHKLLSDQIEDMGLSRFYRVLQTEIRGENGTEIVFSGLSSQTRDSIKSFEGLNIAWVEEAQSVSKRSWDILIPTIRAPDSEIWASFNPDMDTDDTYQRFVVRQPPGAKVVKINYYDNPWRSRALDAEREQMQREAPADFAHIYEGECRPAVEGAIYYNEVSKLRSANRLCNLPYDPLLKVHRVWDLGWNDYMSVVFVQRHASEIRVIRYVEDNHKTYAEFISEFAQYGYRYGTDYIPHDGRAKSAESGRSPQMILEQLGCKVEIVDEIGLENGIKAARMLFPRCYFDKEMAGELVTRLGRYRRRINAETGTATTPVHDDDSHGADAFRYLAVVADQLSNDDADHGDYYKAFRRHG
jgi:phage terminase large subunit